MLARVPKGRPKTAQGNALGLIERTIRALKGRSKCPRRIVARRHRLLVGPPIQSVPDIAFVVADAMTRKELSKLVLKAPRTMVFTLVGNVTTHRGHV